MKPRNHFLCLSRLNLGKTASNHRIYQVYWASMPGAKTEKEQLRTRGKSTSRGKPWRAVRTQGTRWLEAFKRWSSRAVGSLICWNPTRDLTKGLPRCTPHPPIFPDVKQIHWIGILEHKLYLQIPTLIYLWLWHLMPPLETQHQKHLFFHGGPRDGATHWRCPGRIYQAACFEWSMLA